MKIQLTHTYNDIICLDNLLLAWQEFIRGKKDKQDVQAFSRQLIDNIILLHQDLANFDYQHSGYIAFNISDPKPRNIHKPSVRDRLLHHAIYRVLYPFFDRTFTADSYSCRNYRGTHKATSRFRSMVYQVSKNNTRTCWILKCDIKKFFASIDHNILKDILSNYIPDKNILCLLNKVIDSFDLGENKGLPLGNLTSQLFVNVYMNEFDQYVKHKLKQKYYIRYADDFVFMSDNENDLLNIIKPVQRFLSEKLQLQIHPEKTFLRTLASGVDFIGTAHFTKHRVLRTKTKKRILQLANHKNLPSYLGVLKHSDTYDLQNLLLNKIGKHQ
ncbi:reverse transcriptase/maturase family protein [Patescibacteria group bacterium]|nr:reverse transcriptase/maturase family protein [Patescibacteria group bacterium]MBU1952446.1 reverse transcriptase/maturase family protein [Patescibacteria group bacterium]MBU2229399.1 reverse transcriptase/maturase family protein [Patescibacteria group bacterium]